MQADDRLPMPLAVTRSKCPPGQDVPAARAGCRGHIACIVRESPFQDAGMPHHPATDRGHSPDGDGPQGRELHEWRDLAKAYQVGVEEVQAIATALGTRSRSQVEEALEKRFGRPAAGTGSQGSSAQASATSEAGFDSATQARGDGP